MDQKHEDLGAYQSKRKYEKSAQILLFGHPGKRSIFKWRRNWTRGRRGRSNLRKRRVEPKNKPTYQLDLTAAVKEVVSVLLE